MNGTVDKNWYHFPWVWGLILIPMSAVVFGVVMFVMAGIHRDDLVVDDYYKDGMAINQRLSMDSRAKELNVQARLTELNEARLVFEIENVSDSAVRLNLFHVASREEDREAVLVPEGDPVDSVSVYSIDNLEIVSLLKSRGVWYLELAGADDQWRLRRRIVTPLVELELKP
jgi:hypothetical protein